MQDRENLHYLNAVILESHRCIAHVPLGINHMPLTAFIE